MSNVPQTQTRLFAAIRSDTRHVVHIVVADGIVISIAALVGWWLKFTSRINGITLTAILLVVIVACLITAVIFVSRRLRNIHRSLVDERDERERLEHRLQRAERADDIAWWREEPPFHLFWERFLPGFEPVPDSAHCHYIARQNVDADGRLIPRKRVSYHVFIEKTVQIDQFRGFLIPRLDAGHGADEQPLTPTSGRFHASLDEDWEKYLTGLALKFDGRSVDAKRIVFFDKPLLLFLIRNASTMADTFKAGQEETAYLKPWMRFFLLYAHDIIAIQEHLMTYKDAIKCRYHDKSKVKTSDYCDFGYYNVDGTRVVYTPDIRKGVHETDHRRTHVHRPQSEKQRTNRRVSALVRGPVGARPWRGQTAGAVPAQNGRRAAGY